MGKQPSDTAVPGAEDVLSTPDHPQPNPIAPPEEGIVAWLQVIGAFCVGEVIGRGKITGYDSGDSHGH